MEHLEEEGLADRDELALAVGLDEFRSPEFQAALERALAAGTVEWIRPSTYGLPLARLAHLAPPDEGTAGVSAEEPPSVGASLRALGSSLHGLQEAMRKTDTGAPSRNSEPPADAASAQHPLEQIEKLGELKDRGFLSEAEFTTKKSELLARF